MSKLTDGLAEWLPTWLPTRRWFADKGFPVERAEAIHTEILVDGDPGMTLAVVAVTTSRSTEYYQLLIGQRTGELGEYLSQFVIGGDYYDATHDSELTSHLIEFFGARKGFTLEPGATVGPARARLITAEQSNTSLVFGSEYILKLFRRLVTGENRDLRLHRALALAESPHIAEPLGSAESEVDGQPVVLGMLQRFLSDAVDGWDMASASVRDLMAEADLHAEEVGGDFAAEARRLGNAVGAVHHDLGAAFDTATADVSEIVDGMHRRLAAVASDVPELGPFLPGARAIFDAARGHKSLAIQQIHGDLHLGQVLRSTSGWVLIDFEGEPAADPAVRHDPRSPLADIAGMLRSFDYAAHQPSTVAGIDPQGEHQISVRAREWAVRNIDAFCSGYASAHTDPRAEVELLRAFELDKAIYEVGYEHGHRPAWLPIPLAAVRRITG